MAISINTKKISKEVPSGMVGLIPERGSRVERLILNGDIERAGGVGGWQQSERVLRTDADWWKSTPKATLTIPCLLDIEYVRADRVETVLQQIYDMGKPSEDDDPTGIKVVGDIPQSAHQVWKIDNITISTVLWQVDHPNLLRRVALSIELSELNRADEIKPVSIKSTRTGGGKRRRRIYPTKRHDTLRGIAVRELGNQRLWHDIKTWNDKKLKHVSDPDQLLRAGIRLVLK